MDRNPTPSLRTLGTLLDRLRTAVGETDFARLEVPVREHVQRAVEAALAAAARTRDDDLAAEADDQVLETVAAARVLLAQMQSAGARGYSIAERSGRLRGHAVELSAAALALRRQSEQLIRRAPMRVPSDLRGVRVLVVAADAAARLAVATTLSGLGADVRTARCVADALDAYPAVLPDLLVCDVAAAGPEDLRILTDLRERGTLAPALAVAASSDPQSLQRARAAGFEEAIPCSAAASQLAAVVAALARR